MTGRHRRASASALPPRLRTLFVSTALNSIGTGLWLTISTIYLLTVADQPASVVAVATSGYALAGVLAGIPLGRLSDRVGPARACVGFLVLEGIAAVTYLGAGNLAALLAVSVVLGALERGGSAARGALIAAAFTGPDRTRSRALLRSAQNIGTAVGGLLGGVVLTVGGQLAFTVGILGNALTFLVAAVLTAGLGIRVVAARKVTARRLTGRVFHDRPYLVVTAANAVMFMHYPLLTVLIPAFIVTLDAPTWTVPAALIINTVMVSALQVWSSRGLEEPARAIRVIGWAGLALTVSSIFFAFAAALPPLVAGITILVGIVVYTFAELWHSSASFSLSTELAPPDAQSEYQAAYGTGISCIRVIAPLVLLPLIAGRAALGWALIAAAFALLTWLVPAVMRYALRRMPPHDETTEVTAHA